MNRHERRAAAREAKKAASSSGASAVAQSCELGRQHLQAGRLLDAQLCCKQALSTDPDSAEALHLMGLVSLQAGQFDHAIEWIARANQHDPGTDYLGGLGTALEQQGLHQEALKAFNNAVQIRPNDAGLWTRLAGVLVRLRRTDQAIPALEHALKLDPACWHAANDCAVLLLNLKKFEEALVKLDLCNALRPDHAPTIQARGVTLYHLNRLEESLRESRRVQTSDPANADICYAIGITLQKLARHQDALEQFDRALALRPGFLDALKNQAAALTELRRFDEAIAAHHHTKAINPDNAEADWNISLIQLLSGNFERGWAAREARWRVPSLPATAAYPKFPQPMWRGENIKGRTILVCADEGVGDTIQFVRYLPMLSALGARVILLPQESLYPLLSSLPGVSRCLPNLSAGLPAFDFHCPIMSLPFAFGTRLDTIPAPASYLPRPTEARMRAWENRLGSRDRLRVGLVWSGNAAHWNDRNRSIPLRTFSRIVDPGATFVSLQKDPRADDKEVMRQRTEIIDLTGHLTDFAETAALIGCLDLVITVDTSVAHLAAALGCATWILLPFVPDWRWLLDRDDSPWYATLRLFRQSASRDWGEVLDRVRTELALRIGHSSIPSP